jgi:hypothetical protein
VQVEVVTGRATIIEEFGVAAGNAAGTVITADNGELVPGDKVIFIVVDGEGQQSYQQEPLSNGTFSGQLPDDWAAVSAYYVPMAGYGSSVSGLISR